MHRLRAIVMFVGVIGVAAAAIVLTNAMNGGQASTELDPAVAALPECDLATARDTDPPCKFTEDGNTFIFWDGIKSLPGPAPTREPVPAATQSIHPDILATAEAQGITLNIDDYEEVYPGIVHSHFPVDCDRERDVPLLGSCGEVWAHRFDSEFARMNGWPGMQRHGINYVEVGDDLYLDDLSQLTEPTGVPSTSTATAVGD